MYDCVTGNKKEGCFGCIMADEMVINIQLAGILKLIRVSAKRFNVLH